MRKHLIIWIHALVALVSLPSIVNGQAFDFELTYTGQRVDHMVNGWRVDSEYGYWDHDLQGRINFDIDQWDTEEGLEYEVRYRFFGPPLPAPLTEPAWVTEQPARWAPYGATNAEVIVPLAIPHQDWAQAPQYKIQIQIKVGAFIKLDETLEWNQVSPPGGGGGGGGGVGN